MRKRDAIAALKEQADAVRAFGATSLYLFGSTLRDGATAASDLDLFIDYDLARQFSLIELVGIKQLLWNVLSPMFRSMCNRDADSLNPLALRDRD